MMISRTLMAFAAAAILGMAGFAEAASSYFRVGKNLTIKDENGTRKYDLQVAIDAINRGDYAAAYDILLVFAESGHKASMHELGFMYATGKGVEANPETAFDWFLKGAEEGYAPSQHNVAIRLRSGDGTIVDIKKSLEWTEKAADNGHARAQYNWAYLHRVGDGVERDRRIAFEYYKKSAEQGFHDAQNSLAFFYLEGEFVEKDPARAESLFQKAAAQGNQHAAKNLKKLRDDRIDRRFKAAGAAFDTKDWIKARAILSELAGEGFAKAEHYLAVTYSFGHGVEVDHAQAFPLYVSAANKNFAPAQFNLAIAYADGLGTPADLRDAYTWAVIAANNGVKKAATLMTRIQGELKPAELTDATIKATEIRARIGKK